MPIPIQNAEGSQALAAALGLKGAVRLQVDEVEVPTITTDFLPGTPYTTVIPVGGPGAIGGQGAGNEGAISVSPGRGGILVIEQVIIVNSTGGTLSYEVRLMTAANLATVTDVGAARQLLNMNSPMDGGGIREHGGFIQDIQHTTLLGIALARFGLLDFTTLIWDLPAGYALYGDDPLGPGAMAVWNTTANSTVNASFFGKVYKNKG